MRKILLIEDDSFLADIYLTKFKEAGFEIKIARDGENGIIKTKEEKPDLILLDIVLPRRDGLEVLRDLKQEKSTKKIPVVVFSNLGQKQDIEKALQRGAVDYIVKSQYTPAEVVSKVKKILEHA